MSYDFRGLAKASSAPEGAEPDDVICHAIERIQALESAVKRLSPVYNIIEGGPETGWFVTARLMVHPAMGPYTTWEEACAAKAQQEKP